MTARMTKMKVFNILTTGGTPFDSWIQENAMKLRKKIFKKHYKNPDAIDNIERLYVLMREGVITKEEFEELKDRLKKQI